MLCLLQGTKSQYLTPSQVFMQNHMDPTHSAWTLHIPHRSAQTLHIPSGKSIILFIFLLLYINIFNIITPENECKGSFLGGWWVVVVMEGCGRWCWPEEGPSPENERLCSFSGGVGGGAGQRKLQLCLFSGEEGVLVVVVVREGW